MEFIYAGYILQVVYLRCGGGEGQCICKTLKLICEQQSPFQRTIFQSIAFLLYTI